MSENLRVKSGTGKDYIFKENRVGVQERSSLSKRSLEGCRTSQREINKGTGKIVFVRQNRSEVQEKSSLSKRIVEGNRKSCLCHREV